MAGHHHHAVWMIIFLCIFLGTGSSLDDTEIAALVTQLNSIRGQVGATSMNKLVWSAGLQAVADALSATCAFAHSDDQSRNDIFGSDGTGAILENIADIPTTTPLSDIVQGWNQPSTYDLAGGACTDGADPEACTSFVNLMYQYSMQVGCSRTDCGDNSFFVCEFYPSIGGPPYRIGTPCSQCLPFDIEGNSLDIVCENLLCALRSSVSSSSSSSSNLVPTDPPPSTTASLVQPDSTPSSTAAIPTSAPTTVTTTTTATTTPKRTTAPSALPSGDPFDLPIQDPTGDGNSVPGQDDSSLPGQDALPGQDSAPSGDSGNTNTSSSTAVQVTTAAAAANPLKFLVINAPTSLATNSISRSISVVAPSSTLLGTIMVVVTLDGSGAMESTANPATMSIPSNTTTTTFLVSTGSKVGALTVTYRILAPPGAPLYDRPAPTVINVFGSSNITNGTAQTMFTSKLADCPLVVLLSSRVPDSTSLTISTSLEGPAASGMPIPDTVTIDAGKSSASISLTLGAKSGVLIVAFTFGGSAKAYFTSPAAASFKVYPRPVGVRFQIATTKDLADTSTSILQSSIMALTQLQITRVQMSPVSFDDSGGVLTLDVFVWMPQWSDMNEVVMVDAAKTDGVIRTANPALKKVENMYTGTYIDIKIKIPVFGVIAGASIGKVMTTAMALVLTSTIVTEVCVATIHAAGGRVSNTKVTSAVLNLWTFAQFAAYSARLLGTESSDGLRLLSSELGWCNGHFGWGVFDLNAGHGFESSINLGTSTADLPNLYSLNGDVNSAAATVSSSSSNITSSASGGTDDETSILDLLANDDGSDCRRWQLMAASLIFVTFVLILTFGFRTVAYFGACKVLALNDPAGRDKKVIEPEQKSAAEEQKPNANSNSISKFSTPIMLCFPRWELYVLIAMFMGLSEAIGVAIGSKCKPSMIAGAFFLFVVPIPIMAATAYLLWRKLPHVVVFEIADIDVSRDLSNEYSNFFVYIWKRIARWRNIGYWIYQEENKGIFLKVLEPIIANCTDTGLWFIVEDQMRLFLTGLLIGVAGDVPRICVVLITVVAEIAILLILHVTCDRFHAYCRMVGGVFRAIVLIIFAATAAGKIGSEDGSAVGFVFIILGFAMFLIVFILDSADTYFTIFQNMSINLTEGVKLHIVSKKANNESRLLAPSNISRGASSLDPGEMTGKHAIRKKSEFPDPKANKHHHHDQRSSESESEYTDSESETDSDSETSSSSGSDRHSNGSRRHRKSPGPISPEMNAFEVARNRIAGFAFPTFDAFEGLGKKFRGGGSDDIEATASGEHSDEHSAFSTHHQQQHQQQQQQQPNAKKMFEDMGKGIIDWGGRMKNKGLSELLKNPLNDEVRLGMKIMS